MNKDKFEMHYNHSSLFCPTTQKQEPKAHRYIPKDLLPLELQRTAHTSKFPSIRDPENMVQLLSEI